MSFSLLLYNLSLWIYDLLIHLIAPFHQKAGKFVQGRKGLFLKLNTALQNENREIIWMHCASLGEFEQGRPVLEKIREKFPQYALLLTFFSPSGFEIRKNYPGADFIFYLPTDSKKNAQQFLSIVRPKVALFVKYEFWYHYLTALNKANIPAILFSAFFQANQPFFKPYGKLFREMLDCYQQIFVQDENSKSLLQSIEKTTAQVAGDTRFDRAVKVLSGPKLFPDILLFKQDKKLLIAGSSWPEDEAFLKKVFSRLPENKFKLLLVPHEVDEQNIQRILSSFSPEICLWNDAPEILKQKKIAVVNKVGFLSFLYQYSDVVWVGGGFGKGIHNILEPAVFGIPVFFGPRYDRFKEAFELCQLKGAESITEAESFVQSLANSEKLLKMGEVGGRYVTGHAGATDKIVSYLSEKYFCKTE